jgi:ATP-dependent Zn protease
MLPNPPARPRGSLRRSAFYFALVIVLGVVFYFTYSALGAGSPAWTYSQLTTEAKAGHVTKLEIRGTQGVATDSGGTTHRVDLPSDTSALAGQLAGENVNVVYESGGGFNWLALLPNALILGLVIGMLIYLIRRSRNRPPMQPPPSTTL